MRSANQKNKNWYEALLKLLNNIYTNIDVGFPARVISYDKKRHVADIQPLFNFSDGTKKAQLLDIPVAENCYIVDEILERLKPDFSAIDSNSSLPEHSKTNLVKHLPKKKLMRKGVLVTVLVLDRDMDNWKGGRNADEFTPASNRTHDINDAVIIGVLGGDAVDG